MTAEDFRSVINDRLLRYLPDLDAYVGQLPDSTKAAWAGQFANVAKTDLADACDDIANGHEPFHRYEYEQLAIKLLVHCRKLAGVRHEKEQSRQQIRLGASRGGTLAEGIADRMEQHGLGSAFRELLRRVDDGEDYDSVRDEICGAIRRGER